MECIEWIERWFGWKIPDSVMAYTREQLKRACGCANCKSMKKELDFGQVCKVFNNFEFHSSNCAFFWKFFVWTGLFKFHWFIEEICLQLFEFVVKLKQKNYSVPLWKIRFPVNQLLNVWVTKKPNPSFLLIIKNFRYRLC